MSDGFADRGSSSVTTCRRATRVASTFFGWTLLLTMAVGCEGRPRTATPRSQTSRSDPTAAHLGIIDLRDGIPERRNGTLFGAERDDSFAHLVIRLRSLRREPLLKGVYVQLGTTKLALPRAHGIGRQLAAFKQAGLPVVCHGDGFGNGTMLLAALGCSEIWVSEAGQVDTIGLAAQLLFGRSLLDKLAVGVDFLQVGKYKGAAEPFTRDSSSPEARQSLQSTLAVQRRAWLDGVTAGRGKQALTLGIEAGPHTATVAQASGLVDKVGFAEQARDAALERTGTDNRVVYFGNVRDEELSISDFIRIFSGTESRSEPHVAIIRAIGPIGMRGSGSLFGGTSGISARRMSRLLRKAKDDPKVKAIVIRLDTPGGSVIASDLLWNEIRRVSDVKPVVVSVGRIAASGGVYIASAAQKIVAEPTSIVGSIGVVAGKLSFARTAERFGVHVETVRAKPGQDDRAVYGSPLSAWDEATREKIAQALASAYELFIKRVAKGRAMSEQQVRTAAEGRLFAGSTGLKQGLVDELGGLVEAIELALRLAKLPEDTPVEVIDGGHSLLGLFGSDNGDGQTTATPPSATTAIALGVVLGKSNPYHGDILTFLASFAPLWSGELVVAALPYALVAP